MRIISGYLKVRSINFLKNSIQDLLKDQCKENIFNILKHSNLIKVKLENSNILDLYSGLDLLVLNVFQEVQKSYFV